MRKSLAIKSAKLARSVGSVFRKGGTAMPGLVAEKIDPQLLGKLVENNFPKGIVVVTGTNGKTSTSKMIADIFTKCGVTYIRNTAGSNMQRGILATILSKCDKKGRCDAQMAIFEVDEAYIPIVFPYLQPKIVVVTNLFRDQLDRYGELDSLAKSFQKSFTNLDTTLVLNADDPLVASLGGETKNEPMYFGVSDYSGEKIINDHTADSIFDPNTGEKLQYLQQYFGHIGIYRSESSSFARPKPSVDLVKMHKTNKLFSEYDVKTATGTQFVHLPIPGLYNIYNSLAAFAVGSTVGIHNKEIASSLQDNEAAFGRGEELPYKDKTLQMMLIKNPTGFNQIIQTFLKPKPQSNPLLICINDNIADGRDVSWLWDSAIEDIVGYTGKIFVSGTRAYDMALRLKYAGFSVESLSIEPNIELAVELSANECKPSQTGYILSTYTAMLAVRSAIASKSGHEVKEMSQ